MSENNETDAEWSAAITATLEAEEAAIVAVQRAINARVRDLMLESRHYSAAGNNAASRAAARKARFIGRTSARAIVAEATDTGMWRRLFGVR